MVNSMGYVQVLMVAMMMMCYLENYCYTNCCDYGHLSYGLSGVCNRKKRIQKLDFNPREKKNYILGNRERKIPTQVNMMDPNQIEFVANELFQDVENLIVQCHQLCKMEYRIECVIHGIGQHSHVMVRLVFVVNFV